MSDTKKTIIGWIITLVAAIIGVFGITTVANNIEININDKKVEVDQSNDQSPSNKEEYQVQSENENDSDEVAIYENSNYNADKVSIFNFTPVEQEGWYENEGSLCDSLGNTYDVNMSYAIMNGDSYGKYYPNGKFSKLKFTYAPHESMASDLTAEIKVVIDNNLTIFSSGEITRSTEPKTCTLDLKGTHFVTIQCNEIYYGFPLYNNTPKIMLLDAQFIK